MNIAIYTNDFGWAGGIDLLHGIVKGLLAEKKTEKKIYIIINDPSLKQPLRARLKGKIKTLLWAILNPKQFFAKYFKQVKKHQGNQVKEHHGNKEDFNHLSYIVEIFSKEEVSLVFYNESHPRGWEKILKSIRADIILPVFNSHPFKNSSVPYVGCLFDFVYKHHAHLYTSEFCLKTDIYYATTLLNSKSVVVNSRDVYKDINKFFPYSETKVFMMPFAPFTNTKVYQEALDNAEIKNKFGIKNKYFIISNQFWLHKSHETAFEALTLLHKILGRQEVCIVCTGKMTDLSGKNNRRDQLFKYVDELGLSNHIFFVGHVKKVDQLALMLRSEGVLQPTTFEGGPGGGSVYMAIANGIPAIVSDISVNKEIENEPLVTFFKLQDPKDLADKMYEQLLRGFPVLIPDKIEEKNINRLSHLGEELIDCINFTISSSKKRC